MYVYDLLESKEVKVRINPIDNSEIKKLGNFDFDWTQEVNYEVFKLEKHQSNETLGLISFDRIFKELRIEIRLLEISKKNIGREKRYDRIAGILISFACKESFISGFYGFVSLIPKTKLIDHYKTKYGFKEFGKHLAVQFESSEKLMNKYLTDEKE